jgi:imidazolonepropionase-like amidohydrolase
MFHRHWYFRLALVLLVLAAIWAVNTARGQTSPSVGIRQNTPDVHAFVNARIVVSPGNVIEKGTLVIRDGVIEAVGASIPIPEDARQWDMTGMTIYAGLIDAYSDIGMIKKPQETGGRRFGGQEQPNTSQTAENRGPHDWNDNVLASVNADEQFAPDGSAAEKLRGLGFTSAHVVPQKGIFRGSTALFNLGDGTPNQLLVKANIAQYITFETSRGEGYPNSLMGAIALIRQSFIDALWQRDALKASAEYPNEPRPEFVTDLAALQNAAEGKQPVIFETTDEYSILRSDRIAKEFNLKYWVRGTGTEYRQLDAVKQSGVPMIILPVNFPEIPSVQTPEEALDVGLDELRNWDEAPDNPKRLHDAGIKFAFTTATLKDPATFMANVRKAIERGLAPDAALEALTVTPAMYFGVEKKMGTLNAGKIANFIVTDGDLFNEKTKLMETWVDGKRYIVKAKPEKDFRGTYQASLTGAPIDSLTIILKGDADKLSGSVKAKGKEAKLANASVTDLRLSISFTGDSLGMTGVVQMSGAASGTNVLGEGVLSNGSTFTWSASLKEPFKPEPDTSKPKPPSKSSFADVYPIPEYGRSHIPDQPARLLIRGAKIWTCGPAGIIPEGDMLVEKGKIVSVSQHIDAPSDALIVDAKGLQLTPGLIDCHSHSAVAGDVNEAGNAITAEVRIGDNLAPNDIAIYRELAGGLTEAHVLHGSANPIGGQNQLIKLRWGMLAEDLKFKGAIASIKFALGENPKESNWGNGSRYPQTREGVEQIIRDEFRAAQDYEKIWQEFKDGKRKIPPRRNLQLDAIVEILHGKRLVHSHSYRQDEIEMLMGISDDFGFQLGTFQHGLEGYKVADKLAVHGVGVSTFSDWWAYKYEVIDAIPYNGALMHDQGVVVSYNSDSDEQATRLNTEAAKAVKYGGVSPEDALKFVTINPAIQLRVDKQVGSLEPGKDADFVLWNGDPLSAYTICTQTWIEGRKYFDHDEDQKMQEEIQKERSELIQKILAEKKDDTGPKGGSMPRRRRTEIGDEDVNEGGR